MKGDARPVEIGNPRHAGQVKAVTAAVARSHTCTCSAGASVWREGRLRSIRNVPMGVSAPGRPEDNRAANTGLPFSYALSFYWFVQVIAHWLDERRVNPAVVYTEPDCVVRCFRVSGFFLIDVEGAVHAVYADFLAGEGGLVVGLERACNPAQPFRRLGGELVLLRWKAEGETERGSPTKFEKASSY